MNDGHKPRAAPRGRLRQIEEELAALRRENAKLQTIRDALIRQADRSQDLATGAYKLFQTVPEIESSVEKRIQRLARAMSEAKIARRQLQQALESIGEGFILYDANDRIVLCNRKYREIFPQMQDILRPGTSFQEVIRRAAETGLIAEAVTDPQAWIAARTSYHRSSGAQFQQLLGDGRWIQISERATDEGGRVTVVSEITHFKRMEEARRLSSTARRSDVLATTVASIAQGVIVFDGLLNLVTWNSQAAMLMNLPYVEMHEGVGVGRLLRLVWRNGAQVPRERREEVNTWIRAKGGRPPLRIEIAYPGGRVVAANFRGMPDDGFVVTMTDVTPQIRAARLLEQNNEALEARVQERTVELTRLNEMLQEEVLKHQKTAADLERTRKAAEAANLSKTRFLAAASHDLLQPMNSARLYLTALETSRFILPEAHDLLEKIGFSFQSTEALLSTILDISKMDAGGYQLKLTDVDLATLFRGLAMEFDALARERGIALRVVGSSKTVRSDAHLLRRILQNFLSNAIKYTERGRVLLGVRRVGAALSIEVHDTGPGIAPDSREAIFEEFHRAAPPSSPVRGLGLGLAIVRRAADLLGHPVSLSSTLGRGSCFSVQVPAGAIRGAAPIVASHADIDAAGLTLVPADAARSRHDGDRLLVLENDATVANAMSTLFDHWHMASMIAPSYPALIDLLERENPRLDKAPCAVIADLHLDGDIDGIDAIILLREHLGRDLPGILVTADQSQRIRERAKAKRIEYFSKPLKPAQLRAYLTYLSKEPPVSSAFSTEASG